jgi:hypothetical protein
MSYFEMEYFGKKQVHNFTTFSVFEMCCPKKNDLRRSLETELPRSLAQSRAEKV